ncbi:MAG: hypothetical protein SWZ49_05020 [Cyanobacteriota bacterium]|nr:hypothetical protein [Cyanobacteriota bacterium]
MEFEQIDLQQDVLEKLRKATISANAAQKIALQEFEKAQTEADKWTVQYKLALQKSDKQLTSQAQFQKERYQAIADRLKKLVEEEQTQLDSIKTKLNYYEKKFSEEQCKTYSLTKICDIENLLLESKTNAEQVLESYTNNAIKKSELSSFESAKDELIRLEDYFLSQDTYESVNCENLDEIINEAINETKEVLQSVIVSQNNIQEQYEQSQKEVKESHNKVQIALQKNDDNQALNTIVSNIVHNKCVKTIENQLKQQKITLTLIENNLSILEKVKLMLENEASSQQTIDADLEALKKELDEM